MKNAKLFFFIKSAKTIKGYCNKLVTYQTCYILTSLIKDG